MKTICFIDNGNVFHGIKRVGWRFNWRNLNSYFNKKYNNIWQTYIFLAYHADNERFISFCKKTGWKVFEYPNKTKSFNCRDCGAVSNITTEGCVDVALATKLVYLACTNAFDRAIILGGDSDLIPAFEIVSNLGKNIEVYSFRDSTSRKITDYVSEVHYFDDIKAEIEMPGLSI